MGLKNREADGADVETPELRLCGAAPTASRRRPTPSAAERTIAPWKAPSGKDRAALVADVDAVVNPTSPGRRYRQGQFPEIDKSSNGQGYFYVRYESLKNGYIDDVELALSDQQPRVLRVRSSSRVGFLDFNFNAVPVQQNGCGPARAGLGRAGDHGGEYVPMAAQNAGRWRGACRAWLPSAHRRRLLQLQWGRTGRIAAPRRDELRRPRSRG